MMEFADVVIKDPKNKWVTKSITIHKEEAIEIKRLLNKREPMITIPGYGSIRHSNFEGIFDCKNVIKEEGDPEKELTRYESSPPNSEEWKQITGGVFSSLGWATWSSKFFCGLCKGVWNLGKEEAFMKRGRVFNSFVAQGMTPKQARKKCMKEGKPWEQLILQNVKPAI